MKKESIERCMKDMEHCNGIMHTVKSGDTLYSISLEHKVPLALLLRANPYVDVYNLQIGETIRRGGCLLMAVHVPNGR